MFNQDFYLFIFINPRMVKDLFDSDEILSVKPFKIYTPFIKLYL